MVDFLDSVLSQEPQAEQPATEGDAPQPEPAQEQAQPEPQPEPEVQPEPDSPPEQEPEARHVPLRTFLDVRDEAKAAKAERDRYKQQWEEAQQRQQPQNVPDPYDDPKGYADYQEQRFQQGLVQQKFQMSEVMAKQVHGGEVVEAAAQWALEKANSDPTFAAAYHRQPHPMDWIVQQHKRDTMLSDIGDNVDDWFTREAAKRGYVSAPVAAAAPAVAPMQQARTPAPPRSIASDAAAPAANAPTDERAGFLANFTR